MWNRQRMASQQVAGIERAGLSSFVPARQRLALSGPGQNKRNLLGLMKSSSISREADMTWDETVWCVANGGSADQAN